MEEEENRSNVESNTKNTEHSLIEELEDTGTTNEIDNVPDAEEGQGEDDEEQLLASFPQEEESMSRDSVNLLDLGDEPRDSGAIDQMEEGCSNPVGNKIDFVDEGQSLDATSLQSEGQTIENSNVEVNKDGGTEILEEISDSRFSKSVEKDSLDHQKEIQGTICEESNDSKISSVSKEKTSTERDSSIQDLICEESSDSKITRGFKEKSTIEGDNLIQELICEESSDSKLSSISKENIEINNKNTVEETVDEESSDSNSKLSSVSKEKQITDRQYSTEELNDDGIVNLIADETILDEDEETENLVAEVDISSMMEINFDEESESSQTQNQETNKNGDEPEVIPIDSDDDDMDSSNQDRNQNKDSHPVILNASSLYQVDDEENITEVEVDVSSMMEVEVSTENDGEISQNDESSNSTPSRRPRRAAAEAAAKTIHQISAEEQGIAAGTFRGRRKSQEDKEFNINEEINLGSSPQSSSAKQRCLVCLKNTPCSIVIRQYGSDVFLCSNTCFNKFRNQGKDSRNKTLPCAKCGIMDGMQSSNSNVVYFWETMNFCTELCVGRYQTDVGSKCCTCGTDVPWASLGKYCVRFGSDIRQFCLPQCLEGYKRNARVCFNCQLDIRRSGNVILANIPSKTTPKEFCSNDCVEMYCDRNLNQPTRAKQNKESNCNMCQCWKPVYRELVLTNGSFKICSEACWRDALHSKGVMKAEKCEMCTKFVNMDLGFTTPVYWISTMHRIYGFCSHVCKNLYILNSRKILPCISCKVKKYNFDLIEYFTNSTSTYAVCSLACLPKSEDHLTKLRNVLYIPQPTSDRATINMGAPSLPIISSVVSVNSDESRGSRKSNRRKQVNGGLGTPAITENEVIDLEDDDEDDIPIVNSDRILDVLTMEEIDAIIKFLGSRPKMRDVKCMAKPKTKTIGTQTELSELNDMERVPLVNDYFVPVPVPTLINVPFPGYFIESPCPVPFPIPIPIPIPIPVIIPPKKEPNTSNFKETKDGDDNSDKDRDNNPKLNPDITAKSLTSLTTNSSTSATSNNSLATEQGNRGNENGSDNKECSDVEITVEFERQNKASTSIMANQPTTPTPSVPATPEYTRRGTSSNYGFPSPNYSQDSAYSTSIYPSPISNYSPTYGSSPVPPLTPIAPIPVAAPPVLNHISPMRDYGLPPSAPSMAPQMSGTFSTFDTPPRPYMASVPPSVRPAVVPIASGYGSHSSASSMGYVNAPPPSLPISTIIPQPPTPKNARVENALRAWKMMFGPSSDPRSISSVELSSKLCDLVNRGSKPNGERYRADILLYISLGIQHLLKDNNRVDKIFYDNMYYNFVLAYTDRAERELTVGIHAKLEETHFWETSELGATSPGVLLFTLIFMLYKHFGLKTWEMHSALQFSNIMIQSRYDHFGRFVKYMSIIGLPGATQTEVQEDLNTPDRCLIKIYEFYCFKSESRSGPFYKCLRQDYTPRSPWFTSQELPGTHVYQMLIRASMISSSDGFS